MTEQSQLRANNIVVAVAVLAIALLHTVLHLRDLDLRVAGGAVSSHLAYFWWMHDPVFRGLDWPAGSGDFRFSLPMRALLALNENFGVAPEALLWPYGFFQMMLMLTGVGYLVHTLFRHGPTTIAVTALVSVSTLAGANLGNFGAGIGVGTPVLFYMIAHGFKFYALALFLRNRLLLAALVAVLATYSHLTLGIYMVAFIGGGLLVNPRRLFERRVLVAMGLYVLLMLPYLLSMSDVGIAISDVPTDDWVLMSRLFNWHWHPIEYGLFGAMAWSGILVIGLLGAGYVMARRHGTTTVGGVDHFMLGGMLMTVFLTLFGVLGSDVWHVPAIMKLAPQRASELFSLACLFYLVRDLMGRLENGNWVAAVAAAWMMAALAFNSPGIAGLPLAALALHDAVIKGRRAEMAVWTLIVAGTLALIAADHAPLLTINNLLTGAATASEQPSWLLAVLAAVLLVAARWGTTARAPVVALVVGVCMFLVVGQRDQVRWEARSAERVRLEAFKDAQLWARANTASDSVFLLDPSTPTGWREFSGRATYGALAELAHYATLYDSAPGLFMKGIARVREFGIDPLAVDRGAIKTPGTKYGAGVLGPQASRRFNQMSAEELNGVARRHGVTHVVVEKAKRTAPLAGLPLLYSNGLFEIYALRP